VRAAPQSPAPSFALPRNKLTPKCFRCRLPGARCVCALIPRLTLRTRLLVIYHRREWSRTTNTGHFAEKAIAGSRNAVWGDTGGLRALTDDAPITDRDFEGLTPFVLTADGDPLDPSRLPAAPAPLLMIVPDGTWRQALKMPRRIPVLAGVPRFRLPAPGEATYHLRHTAREGGLATLHAIALALGLLEGPSAEGPLLQLYDAMVAATLEGRGPLRRPAAEESR
jgi:DTW domain-containing protein YfiP